MANSGQNGFFHERPDDYRIYVSEEMQSQIPEWWTLNGHVENHRIDENYVWSGKRLHFETESLAEFQHNGVTYLCRRYVAGDFPMADYWWQIEGIVGK